MAVPMSEAPETIEMCGPLDQERGNELAERLATLIAEYITTTPPDPRRLFEAINALAALSAGLIVRLQMPAQFRENARAFFDEALRKNIELMLTHVNPNQGNA